MKTLIVYSIEIDAAQHRDMFWYPRLTWFCDRELMFVLEYNPPAATQEEALKTAGLIRKSELNQWEKSMNEMLEQMVTGGQERNLQLISLRNFE